jgi:hypothetical protein
VSAGVRHSAWRFAWVLALCALACGRAHPPSSPVDLHGVAVDPLAAPRRATVLIFVTTECPISNRYAPEVQRLCERFGKLGVKFFLVYPSHLDSVTEIRTHLAQHEYTIPALRDPDGVLVKRAGAVRTPEAAVFGPNRALAYSGRIDDRFVDFGQERLAPGSHDLEDALNAVLRGQVVSPSRRDAVGCTIVQR